jgi:hypothetical protein
MNVREMTQSKYFKVVVVAVGVSLVALVSFAGGVAVGLHKARFSYAWGENYERNFTGGRGGMMSPGRGGMMERFGFDGRSDGRDFRNAHGVSGVILSIADDFTLVIVDRNNKENTVVATDTTLLKKGRDNIHFTDLKSGDQVVVVGKPGDSGVVNADMIRTFGQATANQ